jgi:hypothetical protein
MPEPIIMYKRRATKLCLIGFLIVGISVFFVLFRPVNCFASASAMEVLFLGTGGPRPDGRAASCNLILVDGQPRFFVDVGSGAFARLGELHIDIDKVDPAFTSKTRWRTGACCARRPPHLNAHSPAG